MNKKINILSEGMAIYHVLLKKNKNTKFIEIYSADERYLGYIDNVNYMLKFDFKGKDEYFYKIEYKNKK